MKLVNSIPLKANEGIAVNALWPPPILRNMPKARLMDTVRTAIAVFCVLAIGVVWLAVSLVVDDDRENEVSRVQQANSYLAKLIEEHVARTLDKTHLSLEIMARGVAGQGRSADLNRYVKEGLFAEPFYGGVGIIGPDGEIIAATADFDPESARLIARQHRKAPFQPLLSQADQAPIAKDRCLWLSRAVVNRDGSVQLMVATSVDLQYLFDFTNINESKVGTSITLVGLNERLDRIRPFLGSPVDIDRARLDDLLRQAPSGNYQEQSADGRTRLFAVRAVKGYPLAAVVSSPVIEGTGALGDREASYRRMGMLVSFLLLMFSSGLILALRYQEKAEARLEESEEQFRQMFNKQQAMMWLADPATLRIIYANEAAQRYYGYSLEEFKKKKLADVAMIPEDQIKTISEMLRQDRNTCLEGKHRLASGELRDVEVRISLISLASREFFFDIIHDITERKQAEERLKYVSFHDPLTGLYNRAYFEEGMRRLDNNPGIDSVGLVVCDVDGLKVVNDTLGHQYGDRMLISTAKILAGCFGADAVVARIGGDEFVVVLENTTETELEEYCEKIRRELNNCSRDDQGISMSVSVGCAFTAEVSVTMTELYKEADNNMYREKLHRGQSARSAIVHTVMSLLEARDFITEGHADRLQDMVSSLGKAGGLTEGNLADLRLLAQFHDIGKVGIPDRILLKPGPLTKQEYIEMQRHCEIGHRIALSSPDLAPIANWILKHHEWWNGGGYPLGLSGQDIPLECRILAIADAYDAMTSDRPYRRAMPRAEAVAELARCSGTQFDPELVAKFIASRAKPGEPT